MGGALCLHLWYNINIETHGRVAMKTREQIVRELKTRDAALKARKEAEKGFNVQLSLAE